MTVRSNQVFKKNELQHSSSKCLPCILRLRPKSVMGPWETLVILNFCLKNQSFTLKRQLIKHSGTAFGFLSTECLSSFKIHQHSTRKLSFDKTLVADS